MGESKSGSRSEWRTPPPHLAEAAAAQPGGWIYEISTEYVDDPDGYVPVEAVAGGWAVGDDGVLTGEYEPNPRFGPPQDDFAKLSEVDHFLAWMLGDLPGVVRDGVTDALVEQVPGSTVDWMKVTHDPVFLSGGIPQPAEDGDESPQTMTLVRAGMAVPFALAVRAPERRREILWGVYSWVAVNLHRPGEHRHRSWFDVHTSPERAAELLKKRLYEVGTPAEDANGPYRQ
ncbi:hypothetical protein ACPA54_38565 [Uniformispora flossi]|uniref:hypothetical protein n=1 Tax=Uniformispora flossi TaxID=3390723 RepID=UPI003C2D8B89